METTSAPALSWPELDTAGRHLDTIRIAIGSDRAIASMLGVSPSQVSRWRGGQTPDRENADRVAALALVVEMLLRWLDATVVEDWLLGPNAHLADRTPAFLIRKGRLADVLGAAEALKAGVYA
jgi:transcriptional regulator with XRE-family HTH domain